jgi:hypothetical protein
MRLQQMGVFDIPSIAKIGSIRWPSRAASRVSVKVAGNLEEEAGEDAGSPRRPCYGSVELYSAP